MRVRARGHMLAMAPWASAGWASYAAPEGEETMAEEDMTSGTPKVASEGGAAWLPWLGWGWLLLLLLATVAELTGWENLRLALDFQRHFH
jgi:hypothetical protein